jgi:hypothetical protein
LLESHATLAVNHIIDALRARALQQCIKPDLKLRFVSLKEDCHGFLKHDLCSDDNLVPQTLIQALEESCMFVPSRTLDTPVKFDLAIKGTTATITRQYQLTL